MSNIINQTPYLRTSREYPVDDTHQLSQEVNKSYVDIANAVNSRSIGIFTVNKPSITGNTYFLVSSKQQSLRQVYKFTSTIDIPLGFKLSSISQIANFYGTYTSGTATYGLIAGTDVSIAGQISFYVDVNNLSSTSDSIKFEVGAGAPAIAIGTIIIEWIANT